MPDRLPAYFRGSSSPPPARLTPFSLPTMLRRAKRVEGILTASKWFPSGALNVLCRSHRLTADRTQLSRWSQILLTRYASSFKTDDSHIDLYITHERSDRVRHGLHQEARRGPQCYLDICPSLSAHYPPLPIISTVPVGVSILCHQFGVHRRCQFQNPQPNLNG